MEQLILNIKNKSKIPFLKELLKHMNFVEVIEPVEKKLTIKKNKELEALDQEEQPGKEQVLSNIKNGLKEVQQFRQGKLKTTSAKDFLNEL